MLTATSATKLTPNQIRGFWAAWAGFALDGMDSFIYALVLTPAMRELLPRSGIPANSEQIGFYGGLMFALFLFGWGCSMLWGPIGDRFGRVRALSLTIVCYSVFTFTGAVAQNIWQLAIFRLLAGIGIGGEWTIGGTFVAEEWPENRRHMGAGYMQTGYYFGVLLAALLNATVGAYFGWRAMFAVGGLPILLVAWIQHGVREPARWKPGRSPMSMLFSKEYRQRTILNATYLLVSIVGLWSGSVYVPSSVGFLSSRAGLTPLEATRMSSWATVLLSVGTIFGCVALPPLAQKYGRRWTLAGYFLLMFVSIAVAFGYFYYLPQNALNWFLGALFILGFATSAGRFVGAGITFLVGWAVGRMGTIGTPVALTSIAFLIGALLLPWGVETKGKELPQ